MIRSHLKTASLSYFLSIILGIFLMMIVLVAFLKFSSGNPLAALVLAFLSTALLGVFLGWVDKVEHLSDKEKPQRRDAYKRRGIS